LTLALVFFSGVQEEERNNRESNLKAFHQLLDEYVLSVTTQWRKVRRLDSVSDPGQPLARARG
jgi:hypothetical protein